MSRLADCMDAMASIIRGTVAANVTDVAVQVEGRMVLNPSPPCVDMLIGDPSEDEDMGAFGDLDAGEMIVVRVRVATADSFAGQDLLLAFMDDADALSIKAALLNDRTLMGTASSVDVQSRSGFSLFPSPQQDGHLIGCTFNVMVSKITHDTDRLYDQSLYDSGTYG